MTNVVTRRMSRMLLAFTWGLGRPVVLLAGAVGIMAVCVQASELSQGVADALNSLVRISGTRDGGTPVRGSGFIVSRDRAVATVVTSSHVIEGVQFEVTFAVDPSRSFPVPPEDVIKIETQNVNGLAAFRVRGAFPAQAQALELVAGDGPALGQSLFLVGYPEMASSPRTVARVFSGRDGQRLVIDQSVGEGFSGGPVLLDNKIAGLITDTDNQFTYAVTSIVLREFLIGSGISLATPRPSTAPPDATRGTSPGTDPTAKKIDRSPYTLYVLGVPNAANAIEAFKAIGYAASLYGPLGRSAEEFQVISIGSRVPLTVAQEVLALARRYLPGLRYVVIAEDLRSVPRDQRQEISLGVTNRALANLSSATPLPEAGWQRLAAAPDLRTFQTTVRAYYRLK